jgi:DNA-binding MarR family transcriptional regulator
MLEKSESELLSKNLILAFVQLKRMLTNRQGAQSGLDKTCHGFKNSEIMLLFRLKHLEENYPEGISVSELSDNMSIKPPSVTSVITVLEKNNMVLRCMDLNDRRKIRIKLTEAGNQFIEDNKKRMFIGVKGLVEHLGPEKSKLLADLINETDDYFSNRIQSARTAKSQNNGDV